MSAKEKRATDALCEIMRDTGHGCCEDSPCWKKAECNEAVKLADAVRGKPSGGDW